MNDISEMSIFIVAIVAVIGIFTAVILISMIVSSLISVFKLKIARNKKKPDTLVDVPKVQRNESIEKALNKLQEKSARKGKASCKMNFTGHGRGFMR